jgi:hypothetical protein
MEVERLRQKQREEQEDRIAKRNSANNFTFKPKKTAVSP